MLRWNLPDDTEIWIDYSAANDDYGDEYPKYHGAYVRIAGCDKTTELLLDGRQSVLLSSGNRIALRHYCQQVLSESFERGKITL